MCILLMALLLISCGKEEKIKVAYVAGITGNLSELGIYGRNAFLLKVDEINASGGIDGVLIEAMVYDDLNDPEAIAAIYEELEKNEIKFVVGHILSSLADAVLEEAQRDDILILSATMSTKVIDGIDDNLLRTCISNSLQGLKMAEVVHEDGHESVLIVTDQRNATYTNEFATTFSENFDGRVRSLQYMPDDGSDEEILAALEADDYSALIMITPALDTAVLSQKSKLMDEAVDLYTVSWSMTKDLISNGGKHVEGMKIVYQESETLYEEKLAKYYNDYYQAYNEDSNFIGEITYEITSILAEAMANSETLDAKSVKANIVDHSFQGMSGIIEINSDGDGPGHYSLYIVKNGEFVPLED